MTRTISWILMSVLFTLSACSERRDSRPAPGAQQAVLNEAGFAYVANCGSPCDGGHPGSVSAYTIDGITGALTEIAGSPFLAGSGSYSVAVDPTGQFVYVANLGSNDVSAYRMDAAGALTGVAGSPFTAGTNPMSVAVDPMGKFVYVANLNSSNVSAYSIDGATGVLTEIAGSPFTAGRFRSR